MNSKNKTLKFHVSLPIKLYAVVMFTFLIGLMLYGGLNSDIVAIKLLMIGIIPCLLLICHLITEGLWIYNNQIEKKTLFGNKILHIKNISSYGIVRMSGFKYELVSKSEYDRLRLSFNTKNLDYIFNSPNNLIYISTKADYQPGKFILGNSKDTITYNYTTKLYNALEELILEK